MWKNMIFDKYCLLHLNAILRFITFVITKTKVDFPAFSMNVCYSYVLTKLFKSVFACFKNCLDNWRFVSCNLRLHSFLFTIYGEPCLSNVLFFLFADESCMVCVWDYMLRFRHALLASNRLKCSFCNFLPNLWQN